MTGPADLGSSPWGSRVPDRWWLPAVLGALLALGFVGALLVRADGDVSLLVHAAPPWTSEDDGSRASLTVQPEVEDGFDGQFFYRLGVSPWSTERTVDGVTFDLPSLRNARWGYGALAFLASGADPDLVPWALVGLNVAAAATLGAVGAGLARSSGHHAAWGLLFVLWPGFAYSISLDTSELVASTFVLAGVLALRHDRWMPGAALFTAAVLTRDTSAVVPFGAAVAGAWQWWAVRRDPGPSEARRRHGAGSALAGGVPLVVFAGWQLVMRSRFGSLPLTSSGDNNLSAPLTGLADGLVALLPPHGGDEAFRLLSIVGLVALLAAGGWCWRQARAPLTERIAWMAAVAVVMVCNAYLWSGATGFMRAATEAGILSTLSIVGSPRRRLVAVSALGLAGLWSLTVVAQLSKLG